MDWHTADAGGGGYFNESDATPSGKSGSKSAARDQILCPVTIRQIIEAPEDGLKMGSFTAVMVSLVGIIVNIDVNSIKVQFTLSDDTGSIGCVEWLESDESEAAESSLCKISENTYYQLFGSIKSQERERKIMVFKICPLKNFNEYTSFMTEVISVNQYAEEINQMPVQTITNENNYNSFKNTNYSERTAFNPIQTAVLQEIKAVDDQAGWSRRDSKLNSRFSKKQIDDALDFLISEGHIYSTIDDDHYSST